jgi:hypothetical protein
VSEPEKDSPQGPVDPHGPGGIDAPAPPGGPQRTDSPQGDRTPGEPAQDPGTPRPEPGGPGPADEAPDEDRGLQEENAATALDEPSDNSGRE